MQYNQQFMDLALTLAKATKGQTAPNPSVGAIIVKNNQIVGIGSHLFAGLPHAEIYALNMAGENACGATLYVTLEPCNHYGKTPPCTEAIISSGIKHVVIATLDSHSIVNGSGVARLREAGIEVTVGILEEETTAINQVFNHYISHNTPYITIKAAMSLDGKLATSSNESKWITGEKARSDAHCYRHTHDAIMVGINTVIHDNPSLTTRIPGGGKNPIRIILDTHLRTPIDAAIITDNQAPTWIITGSIVDASAIAKYQSFSQVKIMPMPTQQIELPYLMQHLATLKISSLLVEGGAHLHTSFLHARLLNQLILYISPQLLGGANAPGFFMGQGFAHLADTLKLNFTEITQLGNDLKLVAHPQSINLV